MRSLCAHAAWRAPGSSLRAWAHALQSPAPPMVLKQGVDTAVRTGCPYCGVGCGLSLSISDGRVVKVRGDREHRSSRGEVCMKAAALPPTISHEGRAARALVRSHAAGRFAETSVSSAIAHAARELRRIVAA